MALNRFRQLIWSVVGLIFITLSSAHARTIQIRTHLQKIEGMPSWLMIVRDIETGKVEPYLFDFRQKDNYWVVPTPGHTYWITVSSLTFGPYAKIYNFCHLQEGVLTGKSMWITLTGILSPDPHSFKCHVIKYNDF